MTTALQLVGVAAFCAGAFLITLWLGLMLTGLSMVVLGHLLDGGVNEQ